MTWKLQSFVRRSYVLPALHIGGSFEAVFQEKKSNIQIII